MQSYGRSLQLGLNLKMFLALHFCPIPHPYLAMPQAPLFERLMDRIVASAPVAVPAYARSPLAPLCQPLCQPCAATSQRPPLSGTLSGGSSGNNGNSGSGAGGGGGGGGFTVDWDAIAAGCRPAAGGLDEVRAERKQQQVGFVSCPLALCSNSHLGVPKILSTCFATDINANVTQTLLPLHRWTISCRRRAALWSANTRSCRLRPRRLVASCAR